MKSLKIFGSLLFVLLLAACSADASLEKETKKLSSINESFNEHLAEMNDTQNKLSDTIEDISQSDKEFTEKKHDGDNLLSDEETLYKDLEKDYEDYEKHFEKLDKIKSEKLDKSYSDQYSDIQESMKNHLANFKSYLKKEKQFLNKQNNMYDALRNKDANFEKFYGYIDENNNLIKDLNKIEDKSIESYNNLNNIVFSFNSEIDEKIEKNSNLEELSFSQIKPTQLPKRLAFKPEIEIPYPDDGVKGIYVSGYNAGGDNLDELIEYIKESGLNSIVIDVKGDYGDIMFDIPTDNEIIKSHTFNYFEAPEVLKKLQDNDIYPIARIVTFKDTMLAEDKPEWSFKTSDGEVWDNGNEESFINPFLKEVWDYNLEIATEAAKLGFKDIQFDYVRFPEGFETYGEDLEFETGNYDRDDRVSAIIDFVDYAHSHLQKYNVDLSVDLFGYAAIEGEASGIGQNFGKLAESADIMSAMIYPSHWSPGYFEVDSPDTEPYTVIDGYMEVENEVFETLDNPPVSRPWIQDFTASYLGDGNYIEYNADEVEAQVQALKDNGVNEFLLWDASNEYSRGVDFNE